MRPLLGAAAIGGLEPAEEIALRAHLDGCAACRAELEELESVARALPLADPTRLVTPAQPPAALGQDVLDRVARERAAARVRRRKRWAVAMTAAAAVIALVVALFLILPGGGSRDTQIAFPEHNGVSAHASLRARDAGTEVAFHVQGLREGDYYWLWLTGDDGDRVGAGTFQGTPNPTDLVMTAALPLHDARRIWVTDAHDRVVLDQRVPPPAS
jgi:hypothetical protein